MATFQAEAFCLDQEQLEETRHADKFRISQEKWLKEIGGDLCDEVEFIRYKRDSPLLLKTHKVWVCVDDWMPRVVLAETEGVPLKFEFIGFANGRCEYSVEMV